MDIYIRYKESELNSRRCAAADFSVAQLPEVTFSISVLRLMFADKPYTSAFLSCMAKDFHFERGFNLARWTRESDLDCQAELQALLQREDFTSTVLAPLAQKVGAVIGKSIDVRPSQWR